MRPLLVGTAVLAGLVLAGLVVAIGQHYWRMRRARQALTATTRRLVDWVADNDDGSPAGMVALKMVPVSAYGRLDEMLVRELPAMGRESVVLGPRLLGMAIRLRLACEAFREVHGRTVPNLPRCEEIMEQLSFTLADLEEELGLPRRMPKPVALAAE